MIKIQKKHKTALIKKTKATAVDYRSYIMFLMSGCALSIAMVYFISRGLQNF